MSSRTSAGEAGYRGTQQGRLHGFPQMSLKFANLTSLGDAPPRRVLARYKDLSAKDFGVYCGLGWGNVELE